MPFKTHLKLLHLDGFLSQQVSVKLFDSVLLSFRIEVACHAVSQTQRVRLHGHAYYQEYVHYS